MKIIFQSDDYGITKAQARGCMEAIHNGVIRNTGFFSNMPWAEEVFEWIKGDLDQIAFGIDLNASTGPSVLPHNEVPHLTHENGQFLGSRENRALDTDENNHDHLNDCRDELYREFDAQIQKFITIVGKKPDYIHNHAYGTPTTETITEELAEKYGIMSSAAVMKRDDVKMVGMGWYKWGGPELQLTEDLIGYLTNDHDGVLTSGKEYVYMVTHCGYADAELFELSSFSLCRVKDLEAMCSDQVKQWVKDNHLELASFKDMK